MEKWKWNRISCVSNISSKIEKVLRPQKDPNLNYFTK